MRTERARTASPEGEPAKLGRVFAAPQVTEWAGHSVDVLLRVYAKCIVGQQTEAKRRIEEATKLDAVAAECSSYSPSAVSSYVCPVGDPP